MIWISYILIICLIIIYLKILRDKKLERYIDSFEKYIIPLDFFMNKSYEMIYKDRILAFSLDGYKVDDKDFELISKEFCKLTIKLMGGSFYKEFTNFFGNEESLFLYMNEYFNSKYEDDEIRRTSLDSKLEQ